MIISPERASRQGYIGQMTDFKGVLGMVPCGREGDLQDRPC